MPNLYLIFDDWTRGYSIRKLDLSSDDEAAEPGNDEAEPTIDHTNKYAALPEPVIRLEAPRGWSKSFTAAFGTMIMAMHRTGHWGDVTIFDVSTRAIIFGPRTNEDQVNPIYIPDGDRLFAFSSVSFELLDRKLLPARCCQCSAAGLPQPACCSQCGLAAAASWRRLPDPVFYPQHVKAYAVHPDGQTIYVTAVMEFPTILTFKFHMEEGWRLHGEWSLPFHDRGHFVPELNAWVGLSRYPGIGHVCSCDLVPANRGAGYGKRPPWKVGKESLMSEDPDENHVGATLVYMGGGSQFCLLECVCIKSKPNAARKHCYLDEKPLRQYLMRVTTFSLKYDDNGDLTVGSSRRLRRYSVPEAATKSILDYPTAFWL
ncbi:unnamed protein product [Urochloa decumbens]|uniref:DUF295 domain-containing protein n=1 Tax=Urochloa decumbens TaxID=240449 RepID=A0ABC8ZWT2_9POAL